MLTDVRNIIGGVAGLNADANSLVNYARTAAQQHLLMYNEDIPVEMLTTRMCNLKQGYTQFGGTSTSIDVVADY
jgi:20S proteasome subunit alpha 3